MANPYRFYTYAYLREDRTPYYIGKGSGNRAYSKNHGKVPIPPKDRILILKKNLSEERSFQHEIYMISVLGRKDLKTGILINRTNGGEGNGGRILNEEHKRKISETSKGRKHTEKTKEKLRNLSKGRKHTEKTIKKLKEKRKLQKFSEETRKKISERMKGENHFLYGKKHSEETKKLQSEVKMGENNPFYGKKHTQKWKNMMMETLCKYEYEIISPDEEIFHTKNLSEFCREHNLHNGAMCLVSQGKRKYHKNWKVEKQLVS
jgi:hypothetical protein